MSSLAAKVRSIEASIHEFVTLAAGVALEAGDRRLLSKDGCFLDASSALTPVDRRIGELSQEFFSKKHPECSVIEEESVRRSEPAGEPPHLVFVVDPIDGTFFYAQGNFAWSLSVGVFLDGKPVAGCVYAPELRQRYYSQGGKAWLNRSPIRAQNALGRRLAAAVMMRPLRADFSIASFPGYLASYGSVALHLVQVASGFAAACIANPHHIWDVAGCLPILAGAGAEIRHLDGAEPDWRAMLAVPWERARDGFLACPTGDYELFLSHVVRSTS